MSDDNQNHQIAFDMICDGAATVSEVANFLRISRQRVDHWCRAGAYNPGRYPYQHAKRRHGRPSENVDPKAARKAWLAAEFKARLAANTDARDTRAAREKKKSKG